MLSKRAENISQIKRLKKNSDFLELRRKGQRLKTTDWLQIHYQKSKEEGLYIGVTSGRKVGSAVIRNRLKRWCLEYFRKHHSQEGSLSGRLNILFRPQPEGFYKELTHDELDQHLQKTLSRLVSSR